MPIHIGDILRDNYTLKYIDIFTCGLCTFVKYKYVEFKYAVGGLTNNFRVCLQCLFWQTIDKVVFTKSYNTFKLLSVV